MTALKLDPSSHASRGSVILVSSVGAATGSWAAAVALACAASERERAALLIDLDGDRAPRPSLIATAAARGLEERLVVHLPQADVASRGAICKLTLAADLDGLVAAVLPLVRDSATVIHLPPRLLRMVLGEPRVQATASLLRADLANDRALTALVAGDLIRQGLRVVVLKRPLGWAASRAALLGALPAFGRALPIQLRERLLATEDSKFRHCYDGEDEQDADQAEIPRREGRGRL